LNREIKIAELANNDTIINKLLNNRLNIVDLFALFAISTNVD